MNREAHDTRPTPWAPLVRYLGEALVKHKRGGTGKGGSYLPLAVALLVGVVVGPEKV